MKVKYVAVAIGIIVLASTTQAALIGEYTFNDIGADGQTQQERIDIALSPSSAATGASLSGLGLNTVQTLNFMGLANVAWPSNEDAYSFGGAGGGQVMFFHRAEAGFGTAWGAGGLTTATHSPLSFTLTADAGHDVTVDSFTMLSAGAQGSAALWAFQEENAVQGVFVQDGGNQSSILVALTAPVVVTAGTSKTFTISINSFVNGADTFLDNVAVNGSVVAIPEPATLGLMGIMGAVLIGLRRLHN